MAQQSQATTIALTDHSGGKLYCLADITIRVPARSIEQVEDAHLVVAHSLCVVLRRRLYALAALQEVEHSVLNGIAVEPAVADANP